MITVNGNEMQCMSLQSILADVKTSLPISALIINGKLIMEDAYKDIVIEDGDEIKVIYPIIGG